MLYFCETLHAFASTGMQMGRCSSLDDLPHERQTRCILGLTRLDGVPSGNMNQSQALFLLLMTFKIRSQRSKLSAPKNLLAASHPLEAPQSLVRCQTAWLLMNSLKPK